MEDVVENQTTVATLPQSIPEAAPDAPKVTESDESGMKPTDGDNLSAKAPGDLSPFTPNFKVKAYDKEFEIPEAFRALVKDAETEKQVREIFEKAYGLDGMKERYHRTKEDFTKAQEVLTAYTEQDKVIDFLSKCVSQKDFDSYFETLGIPEKDLQEWMYKKLQIADLPAEQKALYNRERELQKRTYELEAENQKFKSAQVSSEDRFLSDEGARRTQELNNMISQKSEVQQVAQAFDARKGNGAFFNLVKEIGLTEFQTKGKDLTVAEAVEKVIDLLGPANVQAARAASVVEAKAKPVLPIVEGKQVSPTAKKPNSIADLRKMSEALNASADD